MSKQRKKQLGKGIRALLESMDTQEIRQDKELFKEISHAVSEVPVAWIENNPYQPRTDFELERLKQLADSIRTHGIIQPLTLRHLSGEAYQLISGERRLRAAKIAGLEAVPAYIRLADDQQMLEWALVENIQREDLNPIEVAISMKRLISECALTHDGLSQRLGKDRSTVTNYLRLLNLPPEIQRSVKTRRIGMGHARAIAGIDDLPVQLLVHKQTLDKELSVRAVEALIRSFQKSSKPGTKTQKQDPEVRRIQDNLSGLFGSRVQITRKPSGAGKMVIHFNSDARFNEILDILSAAEHAKG